MYEILGVKHVFSTFQETVWSYLNVTVKGNTAICGGKRLSSKELKASNAHHFLKDGINNPFGIRFFYNTEPRYTEYL